MNGSKLQKAVPTVVLSALILVSCVPEPASIDLEPKNVVLTEEGQTVNAVANVLSEQGEIIEDVVVQWTSGDEQVATVDGNGKISAVGSGMTTITAAAGAVKAELETEVFFYKELVVQPVAITIKVGETTTFKAEIRNEKGEPNSDSDVKWTSESAEVVSINENGLAEALAPGSAQITASFKSLSAKAGITVVPNSPTELKAEKTEITLKVGEVENAVVTPLDGEGSPMKGVVIEWISDNKEIATVSIDGEIEAVSPGTTTIRASSGDKTATINTVVKK